MSSIKPVSEKIPEGGLAGQAVESLPDQLPPNSRPANVLGVSLVEGFGAAKSILKVAYRANSSNHVLAHAIAKKGKTVTVTLADRLEPGMGMMVVLNKEAEITLPAMPAGTKLVVKNANGSVLLQRAITASAF